MKNNLAPDPACEELAFRIFADMHPHEAHVLNPDRFWEYFHLRCSSISRDEMERLLKETQESYELSHYID
jgi:hypothetical protein